MRTGDDSSGLWRSVQREALIFSALHEDKLELCVGGLVYAFIKRVDCLLCKGFALCQCDAIIYLYLFAHDGNSVVWVLCSGFELDGLFGASWIVCLEVAVVPPGS